MPTALIVDDEELSRLSVRRLLARVFPEVTVVGEAENGRAAIEMALALAPDIILMDIRIPAVHGLDAAEKILQCLPDTRIIILSAYDNFSFAQRAVNLGLSGYLLKPAPEEEFKAVFANALRELPSTHAVNPRCREGDTVPYPGDRESEFFRSLASGDEPAARVSGERLLEGIAAAAEGNLEGLKELATELAVSLRREMRKLGFGCAQGTHAAEGQGESLGIPDASEIQAAEDATGVMRLLGGAVARLPAIVRGAAGSDPRARINAAIAACSLRDLSLEAIAERVGMSPAYLSRQFKEIYGVKFVDYIATRRIEAAQKMLAGGDLTIEEVSHRVGYTDSAYFAQVFKERTGLTPKAYTRALRSGEPREGGGES
ncbi:MAG TPA: helix-turn-helix domain-containing protein [Spirochaetia bacterium]